jgi:hypothetical protein
VPERVGVDVALDAPQLAPLAHQAVADDAVAVADDARVSLEVDVQPLFLKIGLRERALAVQRRLERRDDFPDRGRIRGDGGCEEGMPHAGTTLRHPEDRRPLVVLAAAG